MGFNINVRLDLTNIPPNWQGAIAAMLVLAGIIATKSPVLPFGLL